MKHATDGDSRRRKLELESIGRGTFGISADDFIFRAEVVDGEVKIMAQDLRHCGKKIRASALSDARYMMFGRHAASLEHVLPIQRQHVRVSGLVAQLHITDVNAKDKMNVDACMRLCQRQVIDALAEMAKGLYKDVNGNRVHVDTIGTQALLEVMWAMFEMVLGNITLQGRMCLAGFIANMIYFGKAAVLETKIGVDKHWATDEATIDTLILVHEIVNLARVVRDDFSGYGDVFAFDKEGSEPCEQMFSILRQEHNGNSFSYYSGLLRLSDMMGAMLKTMVLRTR